ncbi:MAG: S41 family peptidase [Planctomycetaceae bacterium]
MPRILYTTLLGLVLYIPPAPAQYSGSPGYGSGTFQADVLPPSGYGAGYGTGYDSGYGLNDLRDRYNSEYNRLTRGYDYQAPLDTAVQDNFRRPLIPGYDQNRYSGPSWGSQRDLLNAGYSSGPDPRYPLSDRMDPYAGRVSMPDPFRLPSTGGYDDRRLWRQAPLSRDTGIDAGYESRYRIPLDRVDYTNYERNYRPGTNDRSRVDDRFLPGDFNDGRNSGQPMSGSDNSYGPGLDPFTPPLPRRDGDSEVESIIKSITARYSNPVNVRAVQAMTPTQALALFQETSQQTDQRHLEPTSYDLRIRRGLRDLSLALEVPAFTQSLGIRADSFQVDGFRTTLSRIGESMRVTNMNDAVNVVRTVMQEANRVSGLNPSVVAFEFASATVDTLDKFSALEPAEPGRGASLDLQRAEHVRSASLESEIVGVGVEVKVHDNGLVIMKALRGGPAAEAGLQAGDVITAIDGRSIAGMPMANSVDLMKGTAGSRIQLRIVRNGSRGSDLTLTRRMVRIYTVNDVRILPNTDKVAYLSLSQFGQKSTEELDQALSQLYSSGMTSLVIDLRGNPGGLLNVCVDITNRFLPCGTIVSTKGRLPSDNMIETATFDRTWSTPLVVLVDGDSASASEIFAAAIQDNQRGVVIGERSYGKGTVQTHFPLSSVGGNLRLTTARFYSPSGRAMSGSGVTPDIHVTDADGPVSGDKVLEEAIKVAQSQRLKDIAQAAKQCRPTTSGGQPQRSGMKEQKNGEQKTARK